MNNYVIHKANFPIKPPLTASSLYLSAILHLVAYEQGGFSYTIHDIGRILVDCVSINSQSRIAYRLLYRDTALARRFRKTINFYRQYYRHCLSVFNNKLA